MQKDELIAEEIQPLDTALFIISYRSWIINHILFITYFQIEDCEKAARISQFSQIVVFRLIWATFLGAK